MMAEQKSIEVPKRIQLTGISDATNVYCAHMRVCPVRNLILLATGSSDKKVRLYSSPISAAPRFTLRSHILHTNHVNAVEFNTTGTFLIAGDYAGKLIISDIGTISKPTPIKVLQHPKPIGGAQWCNNDDMIITVCEDNYMRTYDKKFSCKKFAVPCNGVLTAMACSGNTIVIGDYYGWLYRYSLVDPSKLISKVKAHNRHVIYYYGVDILDNDICVSYFDEEVCVWDMKSNSTEKITHPIYVYGVHVPVKGTHLFFTMCYDKQVRMYDRRRKPSRLLFKVECSNEPFCVTSCGLPGQQGGLFVVGCIDGPCEIFRCQSLPADKVQMYGVDV